MGKRRTTKDAIRPVLGVDAGGTYTDVVLLDQPTGQILDRGKSPTTRPDPSAGIRQGLSEIDSNYLSKVEMVSLATTFATNAIVEEVGARAGLVLIGYDEIPQVIPGDAAVLVLAGGHTVTGAEKQPLDLPALDQKLDRFVRDLEAVAVAGFFSVRNPEHETKVAAEIRNRYNLPVVRAHRLSMRLDAIKRATTAWWNARLIPLISSLIQSCQAVLAERGLHAPLMVVRGDGTLMSAANALDRPVDTLLSGPAASILGSKHLAGVENCLIVDMGGTTTDMAILAGGRVQVDPRGARVGRWETNVDAAHVRTVGLGGDSLIQPSPQKEPTIGPRRVIPLCKQAEQDPRLLELLRIIAQRISASRCLGADPCSFFLSRHGSADSDNQTRPELVGEYFLAADQNDRERRYQLLDDEKKGLAARCALTPTDLRVAAGWFTLGDAEAARLGRRIMAAHLGVGEERLHERVEDEISRRLCVETVAFVSGQDRNHYENLAPSWYDRPNHQQNHVGLDLKLTLTAPVVGVGAPAAACMPTAFSHLNTTAILPRGYDVAVAVGAVVGMVDQTFTGTIRPNNSGVFDLHTAVGRASCESLEEAVVLGRHQLEGLALEEMVKNHVENPLLEFQAEKQTVECGQDEPLLLQVDLTLHATGRPSVGDNSDSQKK